MISEECTFNLFNVDTLNSCDGFDCDHADLSDFFKNDAIDYSAQLLGKTYCFTLDKNPSIIVAAFTVSNDSIKTNHLPNARKKKLQGQIPRAKTSRSYPAVLIGRLGVSKDFLRKGLGSEVLDFIKAWFVDGKNKTGCRYIVVDAYNEDRPRRFYENNGFEYLFSLEEQEVEFLNLKPGTPLKTRLMWFDLILLSAESKDNVLSQETIDVH